MLGRPLLSVFAGLLSLLITMVPATAGIIPIPCTGEKIVRLQDLDGVPLAAIGSKVGLGYLYTGCFSGRWIGHTGSDSRYIDAGSVLVKFATAANGGHEPNEPGLAWGMWNYPGAFWAEWLWAGLLALIVGGGLRNLALYGTFAHPSSGIHTPAAIAGPAPRQPKGFGRRV